MPKVTNSTDLTKITDAPTFMRFASALLNSIVSTINGGLQFDQNLQTQSVSVSFGVANTDVSVNHGLNKTGVKYIVTSSNAGCGVYTGVSSATTSTIFLRATAPATVSLELY